MTATPRDGAARLSHAGPPRAPLLVIGIGNPSRGDDALGPTFVDALAARRADAIAARALEVLTDFQLQIEHALDLADRARVVFVDASVSAPAPFGWTRVSAHGDPSVTSHSLSPSAVMDVLSTLGHAPSPEAWTLAIRGERFELGEALSPAAEAHLEAALAFFISQLDRSTDPTPSDDLTRLEGRRITLEGVVQGVGMRPFLAREARAAGLTGQVSNTARGVTIRAFGTVAGLEALRLALTDRAPSAARIEVVSVTPIPFDPSVTTFTIAASNPELATSPDLDPAARRPPRLALPPDLATCDACLAEVDDPDDRHFGYAFTSCAACGPRLSIATNLPYDRAATTMAAFASCPACARDYSDPNDRRYHAQTLACPACGPRLWLADASGRALADPASPSSAVVAAIVARLRAGEVLAIQGHGAFHLVCDATRSDVVAELRRRKRREARPFAILVRDLATAETLAVLDDAARLALSSPARPIVIAPRSDASILAAQVTAASTEVGLMLPSTPLHHLLMQRLGTPLVMTSGNVSGQPVAIDHASALSTLGAVADAFVFHDRRIARRVEDSVVRAHGSRGVQVLRRARGLAPAPIRLRLAAPEPILAVGGHLKNTVCVVVEDRAYLSPHLGDLDTVESERAWLADLAAFEGLLGVHPEHLAHDLHPEYATTRLAALRPAMTRLGVQHHVAHVLATAAELHLDELVLGLAFDGSGWGPDGTSWGGEVLLVDPNPGLTPGATPPGWRLATLRPLPLPGGELAIPQVWRQALAALHLAFGPEALALFARLPLARAVPTPMALGVSRLLSRGLECVPARGLGRWCDAVGALVLGVAHASFEGQVPMQLEAAALASPDLEPYPLEVPTLVEPTPLHEVPAELDLAPVVRHVVRDLLDGVPAPHIASRFHQTIVQASAALIDRATALTGARLVIPTGGAFQNVILSRGVARRLGPHRLRVAAHVPVNDGGLALGQAWAALLAQRGV